MFSTIGLRMGCAAALLLAGGADARTAHDGTPFSLTIKPIVGTTGKVTHMEVTERLGGKTIDCSPPSFRAALSAVTVTHIADSIAGVSISDDAGPVPFDIADDPSPTDFFAYRHWRLRRNVSGSVTVHYRIPVQDGPLRGGPPFGLAPAGGGVAGSGFAFLLLPENLRADRTRIRWDLSMMRPGSIGTFTSGEGDVLIAASPRDVAAQWVLAGPARVGAPVGAVGFHSYVLGEPPFDREALADFGRRSYDVLTKRLTWAGRPDYRLMVRVRDGKSFTTGTAGLDHAAGALVTTGTEFTDGQDYDDVRSTVFHEMTHFGVGELSDGGNRFSEGLTVFLTATLPCGERLMALATCAASLNAFLENYYASPARDWPQSRIEASGFSTEGVRRVPYARGALYFAELNSRIVARSRGRRTLITVLQPMMEARARGEALTVDRFEAALRREIGETAVADFRAKVINGSAAILPPPDAFGPCLSRVIGQRVAGRSTQGYSWRPVAHPPARCRSR